MSNSLALGLVLCSGLAHAQLPPEKVSLTAPADLRVQLFAHEPQLVCPTAFDIDEKGRVWVVEGVNYRGASGKKTPEPPYYLNPFRKTGDRIVVLEDTDGDGKCDSSRVFYEGLDVNSPQGFAVIGGKVWLSQSPNIVTFDINPDGTAGKKTVLLTGFGGIHGDHSVHSLTLGPDGRLYGSFGDTGCDTKFPDGRRLVTDGKPWRGGCVFRMNPDLTKGEIVAHNFRNGYEVAVDSFGNLFMSDNDEDDGNKFCRMVHVMEGGNYGWTPYKKGFDWNLASPGVAPILMRTGAGSPAGLCVYEGKLLPEPYRGMPVLAECGAGWVGSLRLQRHGAGYRAVPGDKDNAADDPYEIRRPHPLLTSADRWFRPSDVAVAPDGSLFVADFYNHIAGGRDNSQPMRGRIYRLIPKDHDGSYRVPKLDLSGEGLIEALGSPNLARRARAIAKIDELGDKAVSLLAPHVKSADRLLKARVLFRLGALGDKGQQLVRVALTDSDPDIRIVAIRTLKQHGADMVAVARFLAKDPAPQVRRELLLALRSTDPSPKELHLRTDALVALANQYDGQDRYYLEAVGIAFRGDSAATAVLMKTWAPNEWNRRVAGLLWVLGPPEAQTLFTTIALDPKRSIADRRLAIEALATSSDPKVAPTLAKLLDGDHPKDVVRLTLPLLKRQATGPWRGALRQPAILAAIERITKDAELRDDAIALSRELGTRPLAQWMLSQPMAKGDVPEKTEQPEQLRDWARARLETDGTIDIAAQRSPRTAVHAYAATLIKSKEAVSTRLWLGSAAGIKVWLNGQVVHESTAGSRLAARQGVVKIDLNAGVNRLLVKIDAGVKQWAFVAELEDPLDKTAEVTDQSLPKVSAPSSERLDPKKLPPDRELLALKGDATRGRQVFLRSKANCATCHKIKGEGGDAGVGPGLDGLGVKMSREAILSEILRPSQSIAPQFAPVQVQTKDGKLTAGIVVEDLPDRLVLKDAQGKQTTIRKTDIEERTRGDVSMMPELLAGEMTRQELVDLLQFLEDLK